MAYETIDVEIADKIGRVHMNRPEKGNSMVAAFWRELPLAVDEMSASGEVRAMVLTGSGRHFCSGMDLAVFADSGELDGGGAEAGAPRHRSRLGERFRSTTLKLQDTFTALERARFPVLCAIQGACIGGGIDMVSAADMRYATSDAFFSIQEINIGMTADVGTLQRMPKLVAEGIVRELAYTGRRWSAEEAKAAGFVNEVYEDYDAMLTGVMEIATEIAAKSPMAIWGTKQTMHHTRDHSVAEGLEYIANWNAAMFDTDDMAEAFKAQMDKRDPDFPDLWRLSEGL